MSHRRLPTLKEYKTLSHQLQMYYRKNYPEQNYPTRRELAGVNIKPTLEEYLTYSVEKRYRIRKKYPNEFPKQK